MKHLIYPRNISFKYRKWLKMLLKKRVRSVNSCLKIFEDYQIKEINEENLLYFNPKTYCLAKLDNFQYAHKIIDEVIIKANENELKACFLDSKGEFY